MPSVLVVVRNAFPFCVYFLILQAVLCTSPTEAKTALGGSPTSTTEDMAITQ